MGRDLVLMFSGSPYIPAHRLEKARTPAQQSSHRRNLPENRHLEILRRHTLFPCGLLKLCVRREPCFEDNCTS